MLLLCPWNKINESQSVEYKLRYTPTIVNDICAFLNSNAGTIVLGYDEKKECAGVRDAHRLVDHLYHDINNSIIPDAMDSVHLDVKTYEGKDVVEIHVDYRPHFVYAVKKSERPMYYVRIGDTTVQVPTKEHVQRRLNQSVHGLSVSLKYEPSDKDQRETFSELARNRNVVFSKMGDLSRGNFLYKYMSLEAALLSLENKNLRFIEPSSWDDAYESRFYNAKYHNVVNGYENSPKLYACCMTSKSENEAAWNIYSHNAVGLASRCVRFKINRNKFRNSLVSNLQDCTIYIGDVKYTSRWVIDNIDKRQYPDGTPTDYGKYFTYFTQDNYINLLLLKRPEFDHEKEVRLFIVDPNTSRQPKYWRGNKGTKPDPKMVPLDWANILEGVDIDMKCSDYEKMLLVRALAVINGVSPANINQENFTSYYQKFNIREVDVYEANTALSQITIQK